MNNNCLDCNNPLEQIPHKRKKQFCNSTCRSNFWQKKARKTQNKPIADSQPKSKGNVPKKKEVPNLPPKNDNLPRSFAEILSLAKDGEKREKIEEMIKSSKLTAGQIQMIYSKITNQ
jgi:hypothetical protein